MLTEYDHPSIQSINVAFRLNILLRYDVFKTSFDYILLDLSVFQIGALEEQQRLPTIAAEFQKCAFHMTAPVPLEHYLSILNRDHDFSICFWKQPPSHVNANNHIYVPFGLDHTLQPEADIWDPTNIFEPVSRICQ